MQLTENFHLDEFRSKDGHPFPDDVFENIKDLSIALQIIRNAVNAAITITSGYRSLLHNKAIGGADQSTHVKGLGADFKVKGMSPSKVVEIIENLIKEGRIPQGGLKAYSTWVHYDIRGTKARW